jgi:hypothetical protein
VKGAIKYLLSSLLSLTFLFGSALTAHAESVSLLDTLRETVSETGQSSSQIRETSTYKLVFSLQEKILKELTKGKTKGGPLDMRFSENKDLQSYGLVLKIVDTALKIIEVSGLTVDSVDAWYAGDRAKFVDSVNQIVRFAIKEGAGLIAGSVKITSGTGTIFGAVVGGVCKFIFGQEVSTIVDAFYSTHLEKYVRKLAGDWFDNGHPSLPEGSDSSTTGSETGTTSPPKTTPKFSPLEI